MNFELLQSNNTQLSFYGGTDIKLSSLSIQMVVTLILCGHGRQFISLIIPAQTPNSKKGKTPNLSLGDEKDNLEQQSENRALRGPCSSLC